LEGVLWGATDWQVFLELVTICLVSLFYYSEQKSLSHLLTLIIWDATEKARDSFAFRAGALHVP